MSTQQRDPWSGRRPRPSVGDTVARRRSRTIIRDLMAQEGFGLQSLAQATRDVDDEGRGISWQLLSLLASDAGWSRDTTTVESARLIEKALGCREGQLFEPVVIRSRRRPKADPAA